MIRLIFEEVEKRKQKAEFIIKCTFLEIYNEELHDLLDHGSFNSGGGHSGGGGQAVIDRFIQEKGNYNKGGEEWKYKCVWAEGGKG